MRKVRVREFLFPVRILPPILHTHTVVYDRKYMNKKIKTLVHNALKIQLTKIYRRSP